MWIETCCINKIKTSKFIEVLNANAWHKRLLNKVKHKKINLRIIFEFVRESLFDQKFQFFWDDFDEIVRLQNPDVSVRTFPCFDHRYCHVHLIEKNKNFDITVWTFTNQYLDCVE